MIVVQHWEQTEEVFLLECTKEEFYAKAAELAECDPADVKSEWTIVDLDVLEPTTVEKMWARG